MINMLERARDNYHLKLLCLYFRYTLSNAEYRLSLERILELSDDETECKERDSTEYSHSDLGLGGSILRLSEDDEATNESEKRDGNLLSENMGGLDSLNAQAKEHILQLQSRLDSMERVTFISYLILNLR